MADSGNPEDLVSQVSVTGTEESLAKLDAYAAGGSKAFDKLNASAQTASKGVAQAGANIEAAGKQGAAGFNELGNSSKQMRDVPGKIKDIELAISKLTSRFPQLTQAVGRFSQRLALVGVGAVAAGVALAASASKTAKALDGESDSLQKQTAAQVDANNAQLAGDISQINYASSLRKLDADLSAGRISFTQYSASLKQLGDDQREQTNVANEVANAQARVKEENDKLAKSLKDRTALNGLIDTFGGPLLTSFAAFGRQIETIHQQLITAFGPSVAAIIDTIGATLSKNATAIGKFFDDASKRVDALLTQNGPAIQKLLENIGAAGAKIFTGIVNAAPGLIDFFNNVLVPAVAKIASAFDSVATAINFVFGTKLTGGSILLIAIIAQMTGSIRLLFTLLRTGGAIFKGTITVVEKVGLAIAEAFGFKAAANVTKFGAAVVAGGGPLKTFLALIRTAIPLISSLGTVVASALGIGFGPAIIIVGLLAAALIFLLTKVDWKKFGADCVAAVQIISAFLGRLIAGVRDTALSIIAFFGKVNDFFNKLGSDIAGFFVSIWDSIVNAAKTAAQLFVDAWNTVSTFFSDLATSISNFFANIWAVIVAAAGVAGKALSDTWALVANAVIGVWQPVVDFFKSIPPILQGVWDTIKNAIVNAFQSAVDLVVAAFNNLLAKAKSLLQPIIDLLKTIGLLSAAAGGSGGASPAPAFAGGGKVSGPGSSTGDKIPAWLSDGEFVVKARSVAKYGAGLLHAINSGRFNMPRFALGGLVGSMAMPRLAYAEGGEVSQAQLRPLTLSLFGEEFSGLMAPEDVGQRLTKFAVSRQNKSAGRKPAWVGRGRN